MFIVKAVKADDSYEMYETDRVRVQEDRSAGTNALGEPPYIAADHVVLLGLDRPGAFLEVGNGANHYAHVYVMNETGKTVDVISWRYNEKIAPPIGRRVA